MTTYTDRYRHLTTQRAYTREVSRRGLPALLAPYRMAAAPECARITRDAIPAQRRRSVQSERIGA